MSLVEQAFGKPEVGWFCPLFIRLCNLELSGNYGFKLMQFSKLTSIMYFKKEHTIYKQVDDVRTGKLL